MNSITKATGSATVNAPVANKFPQGSSVGSVGHQSQRGPGTAIQIETAMLKQGPFASALSSTPAGVLTESQVWRERSPYKREAGGSSPSPATNKKFSQFGLRWAEPVGLPECPYIVRWVLTVFGYSVRVHHWLGSDDQRHFHDHAWDYVVLIFWGGYAEKTEHGQTIKRRGCVTFYRAEHRHTVLVDAGGCWSLLLTGRPRRDWGFYVPGRDGLLRPLRYFSRFGHHPCDDLGTAT